MKFTILLFFIVNILSPKSKISYYQDQLCEHVTDGSGKSKGIKISIQLPCDWKEVESKSSDAIFRYAKKNYDTKVMTSASIDITDLPPGLSSSEEQDLLTPKGLETLSEGAGEIESTKPLKINNLNGGQIIRKDAAHNYLKIRNYFIYKKKLISISYFIISASEINVKDYYDAFDNYLIKTTFN